jgi:hypothetical protein
MPTRLTNLCGWFWIFFETTKHTKIATAGRRCCVAFLADQQVSPTGKSSCLGDAILLP